MFTINPITGAERTLYLFTCAPAGVAGCNAVAPLMNVGSTLYGMTVGGVTYGQGTVFSINPTTGVEKVLYSFFGEGDGAFPQAALVLVGKTLFGTTLFGGGPFQQGTVFSVNLETGVENIVHSFTGGADGGYPTAALVPINGTLYGTTGNGGATGRGTVFQLRP